MNSRLDTLQAAVLQVKLKAFEEYELTAVNGVAERYTKESGEMVYYPKPMSQQGAFVKMDCVKVDLSVTADLCRRVLALPMHPYMAKEEQNKVIKEIENYGRERNQHR